MSNWTIVTLTGGPGGGKTTIMQELRANDPRSERWLLLPEVAPLLFQAGFYAHTKDLQRAVVRLQIAVEDVCVQAAKTDQVLLCHRGSLDPLAYWLRNGWSEEDFFSFIGISQETLLNRYTGVVHVRTAAIGAEAHYKRWPEAHRPETLEQATIIDHLCAQAWSKHPRYISIDNSYPTWDAKAFAIREVLMAWSAKLH